jgi:hypothetical protein
MKPIQNLMKKNRKEIFSVFNEILFSDGKYWKFSRIYF